MPTGNHPGIFWNKKTKLLAMKYNLDIDNIYAYGVTYGYVKLRDVEFIVNNLWIEHFTNLTAKPIELNGDDYLFLHFKLLRMYPQFFYN
jgi:hypothetical protein